MSTTVLDIVQAVLSDMDSDEVNSIGDTIEAMQVASLVERTYNQICLDHDIDSVKQLFQLEGLADPVRPTIMNIPDGVHSIAWIKYNCKLESDAVDAWETVHHLEPEDFINHANNRSSAESTTISVTVMNNVKVMCGNNGPPRYWTSFDGKQVVFDSYDLSQESTLISQKTNCYGQKTPQLVLDGTTPIPLPARFIVLLEKDVRETAFNLWKDGAPPKITRDAERSRVRLQRLRHVERLQNGRDSLPNYGRKR